MINLPFFKVLKMDIPTNIKYWIIKNKKIPLHLLEIIDQTPPITLENTLALPLENFKIHGRTTQKQLSGKNFLPTKKNYTNTINGVTITTDDEGIITINGTCTKDNTVQTLFNEFNLEQGTYYVNFIYLSGTIENNTDRTRLHFADENWQNQVFCALSTANENSSPIVLSNNIQYANRIIRLNNGEVFKDYKFKVQITQTQSDFDYEDYCGGQASPNPDYPQPINNVSGDITISVSDENNTNSQEVVFPLAEGQKLMEGDYLADDGVHHIMGQIELSGASAETWYKNIDYSTNNMLAANLSGNNIPDIKSGTNKLKCSHFKYASPTIINSFRAIGKALVFGLDINTFTDINEWKTWLSINPLTVEYELAEETIDPYTEAQQEAYNNFKNLHGYNNITIVDAISSDLIANVSLKYYAKGWR